MRKQTVNGSLSLQIPDSFGEMSQEELNMFYENDDPNRWGAWDRENHVLITVLWKEVPALLNWLADLKAIAKRNEQLTSGKYEGHEYRLLEYMSLKDGKVPAEGYRFTSRQGDIAEAADTFLVKHGKLVYNITCAGRTQNSTADQVMFRKVVESLSFI